MANVTTELKVVVKAVGKNDLKQLQGALTNLGKKAAEPTKVNFKELGAELKKVQSTTKQTIGNLNAYANAWKDIARNVEIGSKEFKEATAEAARLDKQLAKVQTRRRGGGLRGAAQTAGAIAAGGVFGGPEGAIGAGIGGIIGGPAGAAVGAAIGAQVGGIRQAAGATAEYAANIAKLRIALQGVTTSQAEYSQGLAFIQQTTKDFAIPQEVVTRQFTKLQASVQGAGGNLEDTKTAFNGIVAAVRATGGSLADVDAALTATAQVFSKGKVSAEELRQQIGERLPGAFTLFAESMGLTPQELDKALEKGQVSLQDFQKFAKAIFDRYGENAKAIAAGPESAGDRLKVQLERLSESVGTLLRPIGAFFQETFGAIVRDITRATNALARFLNLSFDEGKLAAAQASFTAAEATIESGTATAREKQRAVLARERARKIIETQTRLRDAGVDVEQPGAGGGLPGITEDLNAGKTKAAKEIVDITQQEYDLRQNIIEARQLDNDFLEATLKADLKRLRVQQSEIGELEKKIRLQEINQAEGEEIAKIIEKRIELLEEEEKAAFKAGKAIADAMKEADKDKVKTFGESFKEVMQNAYKQATDLGTALGGVAVNAIDGMTDAIVEFATTGKAAFAEFTRSILADLAKIFLRAALFQGLKLAFPGLNLGAANGAAFNSGGQLTKYAAGGVVNAPTFFRYQDGGQFKNGVMGEAGPEAILPLKRGSDGKLGVTFNESSMRESMARYSRDARGSSVISEAGGSGTSGESQAIAGGNAIDVRYTVERINSVDYVTADQFQRGMRQAAAQGATQGEQRALTTLRQNTSQRRRIGL